MSLPDNVRSTVQQTNSKFYPNISTILRLLFLMSVSAASLERSHSRFKNVKTKKRSVMSKDRLNSLMLLYVHRDLQLDYDKIMDIYVSNYPRRLQLAYPLLWCSTPWCISCLTIHTNIMIIKRLCQIVFFVIIYLCYNVSNIAQIAQKYALKTSKSRKLPGASPPWVLTRALPLTHWGSQGGPKTPCLQLAPSLTLNSWLAPKPINKWYKCTMLIVLDISL